MFRIGNNSFIQYEDHKDYNLRRKKLREPGPGSSIMAPSPPIPYKLLTTNLSLGKGERDVLGERA
jgi:hypothetical protein